jgi:hypothetical protein
MQTPIANYKISLHFKNHIESFWVNSFKQFKDYIYPTMEVNGVYHGFKIYDLRKSKFYIKVGEKESQTLKKSLPTKTFLRIEEGLKELDGKLLI